jgi:RNA polymerase sigma-70 factor (ECF subfamily)
LLDVVPGAIQPVRAGRSSVKGGLALKETTLGDFESEADRLLLRAVAGGSTDSLGRLYDRHAAVVYGLARRIVRADEDAEEVVQDVFTQVWRDASRYEAGRASVAGWLVMLTRARAIDRLRAKRARPDLGQGSDSGPSWIAARDPDPEEVSNATEEVHRVREAVTTLPDAQRSLVELAYFQGLTHTEIAHDTGVPLGTVKTRLRSAMATLREAVAR